MRELGKYILIMVLELLLVGLMVADIFAGDEINDIRYKFTGEKSRFQITTEQVSSFEIFEDWEDRTITVVIPGSENLRDRDFDLSHAHDYIIKNAFSTYTGDGYTLTIKTNSDFKTNVIANSDKRLILIDVYLNKDIPNTATLFERSKAYEKRGLNRKALNQLQKAREIDSNNSEILYGIFLLEERVSQEISSQSELPDIVRTYTTGEYKTEEDESALLVNNADDKGRNVIEDSQRSMIVKSDELESSDATDLIDTDNKMQSIISTIS